MRGTVAGTLPGVVCGQCGGLNLPTRRRCGRCGALLVDEASGAVRPLNGCPACGVLAPRGARSCGICGGPTELTLARWQGSASRTATAWTQHVPVADVAPGAPAQRAGGERWHGTLALALIGIVFLAALVVVAWMVGW